MHRHSFTWAKSLTFTTGNTQKSFDTDRAQSLKLNFIEFIVYLCVLGQEINLLQKISGMEEKNVVQSVFQVLQHLMAAFQNEVK